MFEDIDGLAWEGRPTCKKQCPPPPLSFLCELKGEVRIMKDYASRVLHKTPVLNPEGITLRGPQADSPTQSCFSLSTDPAGCACFFSLLLTTETVPNEAPFFCAQFRVSGNGCHSGWPLVWTLTARPGAEPVDAWMGCLTCG